MTNQTETKETQKLWCQPWRHSMYKYETLFENELKVAHNGPYVQLYTNNPSNDYLS